MLTHSRRSSPTNRFCVADAATNQRLLRQHLIGADGYSPFGRFYRRITTSMLATSDASN